MSRVREVTAVTGGAAWLGALAVLVAMRAGLTSLESLLAPGAWLTAATAAALVVLVAAAATRTLTGAEWAPVSGLVAGLLVVTVGYGGAGPGPTIPDLGTPGRLVDLIAAGFTTVNEGRIPVLVDRGLELVVVAATVALVVVVDALAFNLRLAGTAGLGLAALWAPALVFERPPSTGSLLVGGAAWVVVLWLTATRRRSWRELPAVAAVAAVAAVGAMLVGPLTVGLPGYASVRLPATWGPAVAGSGRVVLSENLDIRADLGTQPATPVLRYRSDLADVGPLRTTTVTTFDGRRWVPSSPGATVAAVGLLWPTSAGTGTAAGTIDVELLGLDQPALPIPLEPRTLDLAGQWTYDLGRDVVLGDPSAGLAYRVAVSPRDLEPDVLRGDRATSLGQDAPELAVPDSPFAGEIAALADAVAGAAPTTYDQALALQQFFRSGDFTYQTDLPPARTDDPLWDFLTVREGYCVQYASAMAVMARHLGIPSRVGIGFLPGERDADGTVTVTADRAHTWPELWFAEAGWVRFEPTPAVQTGAPPAYADPAIATLPTGPAEELPTATATPSLSPTPTPTAGTGGAATGTGGGPPWGVLAALAGLTGLGGLLWWRVRRTARPVWGPEEAWARVRREAERSGVRWPESATPRQAVALLLAALPEDEAARAAVHGLGSAVEDHRYAPQPDRPDPEALVTWVGQIGTALSAARRVDAPSAPRGG